MVMVRDLSRSIAFPDVIPPILTHTGSAVCSSRGTRPPQLLHFVAEVCCTVVLDVEEGVGVA